MAVPLIVSAVGCDTAATPPPVTSAPTSSAPPPAAINNPFEGRPLFVDPTSAAGVAARTMSPASPELATIASVPQAHWIDQQTSTQQVGAAVESYLDAAYSSGTMPVLTLYAIPGRDCASFSGGGFGSGADYRRWIDAVSTGLIHPAVVILEPDALAQIDCLLPRDREERFALLRYGVEAVSRTGAAVYVDGGHSRWLTPPELTARLQRVGIEHLRGFSLNVSNFLTTEEEIGYGEQVSARTGLHYVIDTSRNGRGPAPEGPLNWCNPPGRAIGVRPTSVTAGPNADAYLWVKRPGESDGTCDRRDPPSGTFMPDYAVALVRNAQR